MHVHLRRCVNRLLATGFVVGPCLAGAQSGATHPFGLADFSKLREAHAVAVSPDGLTILYDVSYFEATGAQKHEWHTIGVSGDREQKLELPEHFAPVGFMPDGSSVYGSVEAGGAQQIAIVPLDKTKPIRTLSLASDMHAPAISPDGKRFLMIADPRAKDTLAAVRTVIENDQNRLYVVGVDGADAGWWCPALSDVGRAVWSPDGTRIAVASQTPKIGHHDVRTTIDVCDQSGAKRVADLAVPTSGLAWADDGKTLVFASTRTQVLTPDHVWTVAVDGGTPADRTPDFTGSAVGLVGSPRGSVWVEVHNGVTVEIDTFRDGQLTPAFRWPNGVVARTPVFSPFPASPEVVALAVGDPTHTENVAVDRGGQLVKITHEGDEAMGHLSLGDVRVVNWTAKDGTHLEAIATFPAGYRSGAKAPFLVLPHGGPEGNDPLEFDTFSRFVAGLGYVVLQPQYRGSTGYGSAFLDAIYQHFGDRAYNDVSSATDYAVAQGWADPNHLAIFGWSAGGFMTAWTVTRTQRYRAAIEGAGITDWLSFIPTSDIAQVDYDARLQEKDATPFLTFSAVMYVDRVTTPLLILHGAADPRVPTFQGREFFVLLAERGKTVRMVTYPGSPHFPRLAEQQRNVFQEVADWLAKYNN